MGSEQKIIPDEWDLKTLGDIADVSSGGSAPQGDKYFDGESPFVRVQHIDQDTDSINRYDLITDEAVKKYKLKKYKAGTIVFPKSGASIYLEKRAVLPVDAYIASHLCAVNSAQRDVYQYFLFYSLKHILLSKGKADGYPTLNLSEVKRVAIPVPAFEEQKKVVRVLSVIKKAIEQQEKIITKTKKLKRSLMHWLFTYGLRSDELKETENGLIPVSWSLVPLEKIVEVVYGAQAAVAHALDSSIGTPIFTNINITNTGDLDLATLRYYKVPDKKRDRLILEKGDILFNWRSGSKDHVGKTAFFDLDGEYTFSSFILRFRTKKTINNIYLYWYLQFLKSIGYFSQYRDQSSVNSVFNASAASVIPVAVCGKEEQIEIGETLCAVNNKIKEEQNRLVLMKSLFKSMLNNLMTGKVRVRDIDFEGVVCE